MIATYINCVFVLLGSMAGLLFKRKISPKLMSAILQAMGLAVLGIGLASAVETSNILCLILSMVVGTAIGVGLGIEERLNQLGDWLNQKIDKKGSGNEQFTQGFVSAFLLFCVGSMTIMGSMEAGINHDYSILFTKSVMDAVAAVSFAATMGTGVIFAIIPLLLYQGALTLLAGVAAPFLSTAMVTEMSAVGGTIILGVGLNCLYPERHIPVGNMLPAIFLPLLFLPAVHGILGAV